MILRKARRKEIDLCYQCIQDARAYHKSLGFTQWHPGYPTPETLAEDIDAGIGYAFVQDSKILGYCCIIIGEEPAYQHIQGAWKTDRPYAVVHRMAFSRDCRGTGLSSPAITLIKQLCQDLSVHAIRVDTQEENKPMQHILAREGFSFCGTVTFDGGPKLAYEWDR